MATQTPTQVGQNHEKIRGTTPPAFGELLRRYRAAAGLTQEGLAERSGLSVRGVSDLERGQRTRPHHATLGLLATALGLSAVERDALTAAARARGGPELGPGSLPVPLTSFVGRERELAEVGNLMGRTRLLTLVGSGGCGKTRLAVETARQLLDDHPDGAWFVDLS